MSITVRSWDDPISWNQFVASTPSAHFQQSWEWGDLAPDLGGRAVRLGAVNGGTLVGAAQIIISNVRQTKSTSFYIPRGPAVHTPDIGVLGPLLDRARLLGQQCSAVGIKVEPNASTGDTEWLSALQSLGLKQSFPPIQPRSSWLLDISRDADTLLSSMKQKTRYNIRLAARKGVQVEEGTPADLKAFYDLYRETAERDDFFIQPLPVYERMFAAFWAADNFCLLLARYEEQLIAAVTLVRFGETCWYLHGASGGKHRNLMAPYLLQWEAIQHAKRWGAHLYDFRAVPDLLDESQDMFGVYRFKEGFGGYHFMTLPAYATPYRSGMYGIWQAVSRMRFELEAWKRRRRGLPRRQHA
ncbi:MAG: peptidoglycan bridge formation glycyltransferase FemA/FemB family protein [Chloroflexota bacterium]